MAKILVVDDIEQNRYMRQVLLKGHGYEVGSAPNGAEALEISRKDVSNIIISDILMPVMDGFALCHACKKDEWVAKNSLRCSFKRMQPVH